MIAPFKDVYGYNSLGLSPHKLWSLWDMLKVSAKSFIELGEQIESTSLNFFLADTMSRVDPSDGLRDEDRDEIRRRLVKTRDICRDLDLPISESLILSRTNLPHEKEDLPETQREFDLIMEAVKKEIQNKLFLFVPSHLAKYYEDDNMLSDVARAAFPSATTEMRSAGNCMTAGFNTACVFHCMRAVEHGLRALAGNVGISFGVQHWQNVIDQIESEIGKLGKTLKAGTAKTERLQFLSEASAGFLHFKDGWRNHVMHARANYDEPQATNVINHVRIFLEALSTNLKEVV